MAQFVNNYVKGCAPCQQYKINRRPTDPPLFPIEASREPRPFAQCSMDLIMDLPTLQGYDSILVIVDHGLTKGVILTPCTKSIDTERVGDILFQKLLTKHGKPNKMISNRGPQLVSNSMIAVLELMGIKSSLSTAFHPQTDGATERVNQEIQAYLWIFCMVNPDTWAGKLPMVEFTHNSRNHADRQYSPFELLYGY
jgi:transposase InsO family protein